MSRRSNPLAFVLAAGIAAALPGEAFAQQSGTAPAKKKAPATTAPSANTGQAPRAETSSAGADAKPAAKKAGPVQQTQGTREAPANRPRGATVPVGNEEAEPAAAPERPTANPMRVRKLDPEVEQILKDWEAHSATIKELSVDIKRYKYDHVWGKETRGIGKAAFGAPDRGAYQLEGAKIAKGEVSQKVKPDGEPYELEPDEPERWVCTGAEVLRIDDRQKQYEKVVIPADQRGENIIDGPLPFLFGMKAEQAKRRYVFKITARPARAEKDSIWMSVEPLLEKDAINWSKATVGLSGKTYLPLAVMLADPSGNAETVHIFTKTEVNGGKGLFAWAKSDPFKPDLKGYQPVLNGKGADGATKGAPPQGARSEAPLGARPPAGNPTKAAAAPTTSRGGEKSADATASPAKKPAAKAILK